MAKVIERYGGEYLLYASRSRRMSGVRIALTLYDWPKRSKRPETEMGR